MPGDDLPEAPDMEAIEVEVSIKDDVYTHEEYTTRFLLTQRQLEVEDPYDIVRMATEQTLDGAVRQYLSAQRGRGSGVDQDG